MIRLPIIGPVESAGYKTQVDHHDPPARFGGAFPRRCWRFLAPLLALSRAAAGAFPRRCWRFPAPLLALSSRRCWRFPAPLLALSRAAAGAFLAPLLALSSRRCWRFPAPLLALSRAAAGAFLAPLLRNARFVRCSAGGPGKRVRSSRPASAEWSSAFETFQFHTGFASVMRPGAALSTNFFALRTEAAAPLHEASVFLRFEPASGMGSAWRSGAAITAASWPACAGRP